MTSVSIASGFLTSNYRTCLDTNLLVDAQAEKLIKEILAMKE